MSLIIYIILTKMAQNFQRSQYQSNNFLGLINSMLFGAVLGVHFLKRLNIGINYRKSLF